MEKTESYIFKKKIFPKIFNFLFFFCFIRNQVALKRRKRLDLAMLVILSRTFTLTVHSSMNDRHTIKYRINQTNLTDTTFHRVVIPIQITKIQIRRVVHPNISIIINIIMPIIDRNALPRLTIVRMKVMMIVRINDRNTRNDDDRLRVNVAIHRTKNRVDLISIMVMRIGQFHGTEAAEVRHIQVLNTNHDHVLIREIGDRIIVINLNANKSVSINLNV